MKQWLIGCHVWDEEDLRSVGWTDETLRAPHAYRVRERVPDMSYSRCVQVEIKPTINNERDELIDDIDALCLSIEKRQNELSRLVKKLKG